VTWADVERDPLAVAVGRYAEQHAHLPDDVFVGGERYPVHRFVLSDLAHAELEVLCELLPGVRPAEFVVRLDRTLVEQAVALKAAHATRDGYLHVVVGREVASQLAGDHIAACLRVQRERQAQAEQARECAAAEADAPDGAAASLGVSAEERERVAREEARRQREVEQAAREQAMTRNEVLGAALVKHLSKVKVDDRVLRILTAAPLADELVKIAARGARLGFPGWFTRTERKNGSTKLEVLDEHAAHAKAREYLAGASTAAEVAGRCLALLAMARWADETVLPRSRRSFYALRLNGADRRAVARRGGGAARRAARGAPAARGGRADPAGPARAGRSARRGGAAGADP